MAINLFIRLRDNISDKPRPLFLKFKYKQKVFKWSLGTSRTIHPQLWDNTQMRPISVKYASTPKEREQIKYLIKKHSNDNPNLKTDLENISIRIDNVLVVVKKYIDHQEHKGEGLDYEELKSILNKKYSTTAKVKEKPKEAHETEFITDYYKYLIEGMKTGEIVKDTGQARGQRYDPDTIRTYGSTLLQWKNYEEYTNKRLRWKNANIDLYDDLVKYYYSEELSPNYIGKIIKNLKVVLRRAYDKGLHSNEAFKDYIVLKMDVRHIALSVKEVELIRNVDISNKPPKYEHYRDVFLVGCYTALRYSDASRIRPEHVKGANIDMHVQKGKKRVVIPISSDLRAILDKYGNHIPKTNRQHLNDAMKEIGKMAGLTELIETVTVKGGLKVFIKTPKYKMISSHTARRTKITLMYLANYDLETIRKLSGHTTIKMLTNYIKVDAEENAKRITNTVQFRQSLLKVVE